MPLNLPLTLITTPPPLRSDRVTIRDKDQEHKEEEEKEKVARMQNERRKKESVKLVAAAIASELQKEQGGQERLVGPALA